MGVCSLLRHVQSTLKRSTNRWQCLIGYLHIQILSRAHALDLSHSRLIAGFTEPQTKPINPITDDHTFKAADIYSQAIGYSY